MPTPSMPTPSVPTPSMPPAPRSVRRRLRRWFVGIGAAILLLIGLLSAGLYFVLTHLNHAQARALIGELARTSLGFDFTYESLRAFPPNQVRAQGIRLLTPSPFARFSPFLLELDRLDLDWNPGALWDGELEILRLELSGLRLTLVRDDQGRSSLDPLLAPSTAPAEALEDQTPQPVSGLLELIPDYLHIVHFFLHQSELKLLDVQQGRLAVTHAITGLTLAGQLSPQRLAPVSLKLAVQGQGPERTLVISRHSPAQDGSRTGLTPVPDSANPQPPNVPSSQEGSAAVSIEAPDQPLASHALQPAHLRVETHLGLELEGHLLRVQGLAKLLELDWPGAPTGTGPALELLGTARFLPDIGQLQIQLERLAVLESGLVAAGNFAVIDRLGGGLGLKVPTLSVQLEWAPLRAWLELPSGLALDGLRGRLRVEELDLDLDSLEPTRGQVHLEVEGKQLSWQDAALTLRSETVGLKAKAQVMPNRAWQVESSLTLGPLETAQPDLVGGARELVANLELANLQIHSEAPEKSSADATLLIMTTGLELDSGLNRLRQGALTLRAQAPVRGLETRKLGAQLEVQSLDLLRPQAPVLRLAGLSAQGQLSDLSLDLEAPLRSAGKLQAQLSLEDVRLGLEATLDDSGVRYLATLQARGLRRLAATLEWAMGPTERIHWAKLGLDARSEGLLSLAEDFSLTELDQRATCILRELELRSGERTLEAGKLELGLNFKGLASRHILQLDLNLPSRNGNLIPGSEPLRLKLKADNELPALRTRLVLSGSGAPGAKLSAQLEARFEPDARRLSYASKGAISGSETFIRALEALEPGLYALANQPLELSFESEGSLTGILERLDSSLSYAFAEQPLRQVGGTLDARVALRGLGWKDATSNLELWEVKAVLGSRMRKGAVTATLKLDAPRLEGRLEGDEVRLEQSSHLLTVKSDGPLEDSLAQVTLRSTIARLSQTFAPYAPPADLLLEADLRMAQLSAVRADQLLVRSEQLGTELIATAAADRTPGRPVIVEVSGQQQDGDTVAQIPGGQGLAVRGRLTQRLDRLSGAPGSFVGTGTLEVPFTLASPDHEHFRLESTLRMENVELELPDERVKVTGVNGRVLVREELRYDADGIHLIPAEERNAYARASFPDTQPFLSSGAYFSALRMQYQDLDAGPVAGNLSLDQTLLRLDQLQMGFAEGTITGQLLLSYGGKQDSGLFRGNATGLRLTAKKERLDANLALELKLSTLELNGQAHLVQIGPQTLQDFLDVLDPYREDVTYNRIRLGLKVGYPEFMRLRFDHGFMNAQVKLGGAARKLRIDEIRAVPIGPLLNRYLAPYL